VLCLNNFKVNIIGSAATTGLLYKPQMIDDGDCGETGGMKTGRGNTQISMPRVGFEPTIPVFERPKTIHALDRAATVIGSMLNYGYGGRSPSGNFLLRPIVIRERRRKYIFAVNLPTDLN
jgi:hypothetical protein